MRNGTKLEPMPILAVALAGSLVLLYATYWFAAGRWLERRGE